MKLKTPILALALALFALAPASFASVTIGAGREIETKRDSLVVVHNTALTLSTEVAKNVTLGIQGTVNDSFDKFGPVDAYVNVFLPAIDKSGETIPYFGLAAGIRNVNEARFTKDGLSDLRMNYEYGGQMGVKHTISDSLYVYGEGQFRTNGDLRAFGSKFYAGIGFRLK